jgi:hypothetical protein
MTYIIIAIAACSALFVLGYHLGNQQGRTAHIREDIRKARETRVVARIAKN